jgi:hypothetical protein
MENKIISNVHVKSYQKMAVEYGTGRIATNGLVLALDAADRNSYPGSGTTWIDLSKNGNNGTLTNAPIFDSSNGGMIVFDGQNDVVTVPNTFPANQSITLCAWTRIRSDNVIIDTLNDSVAWDGFGLWIVGGKVRFYLLKQYSTPGPLIQLQLNSNATVSGNKWVNLCCVYNGTQGLIYINGVLDTSANYSGGYDVGQSFIGIGARQSAAAGCNCDIANVSIYNRALSAAEVLQNYNAQKSRFGL